MTDRNWWAYGYYTGEDCPKCQRQRMMLSLDNDGKQRIFCEKCEWEPAKNDYIAREDRPA